MSIAVLLPPSAFSRENKFSEGETLFHRHCAVCHGRNGIGQDPENPAGGWDDDGKRLAPSLDSEGHAWHHPPELLFGYVKEGSVDDTSPMPSFGAVLKDEEIESIVRYIESLWSEEIQKKYRARFSIHPGNSP